MITTQQYHEAAMRLNVEIAAIKAVDEVESGGSGFLNSGQPVILFEPHVFWRELKKREVDPHQFLPENEDILYEKWGTHPYKKSSEQHAILDRAVKLHREAALCSASWGRYQIMGNNYRACGCSSIQEFINAIYKDENEHLRLFCNFLKSTGLDTHLRNKAWEKFAKGYNGASYEKNRYHLKLNTAYLKHRGDL